MVSFIACLQGEKEEDLVAGTQNRLRAPKFSLFEFRGDRPDSNNISQQKTHNSLSVLGCQGDKKQRGIFCLNDKRNATNILTHPRSCTSTQLSSTATHVP
jgi:hypothetical protein